uniref:Uncharacterized protein n=1 Tax=Babesia sp. BQ1/Lintan TaxID=669259 RepID=R9QRW6_9APIC|nr:hypothetical protein [Babesia sp. BQ1/Lintan]
MIYAVIGKLRQDPFADHLLKVRRSQPPPIREPFPRCESNENSTLTRFLDSCASLVMERLRGAEYDFDAVMDRNFSDNFAEMMPTYTNAENLTSASEDTVSGDYVTEHSDVISEAGNGVPSRGSSAPWTRDEVKLMLKRVMKLGLTKPSTIIARMRRLHCDIGFSFEDLLWLGRTRPQLFRLGWCKNDYGYFALLIFRIVSLQLYEYTGSFI